MMGLPMRNYHRHIHSNHKDLRKKCCNTPVAILQWRHLVHEKDEFVRHSQNRSPTH